MLHVADSGSTTCTMLEWGTGICGGWTLQFWGGMYMPGTKPGFGLEGSANSEPLVLAVVAGWGISETLAISSSMADCWGSLTELSPWLLDVLSVSHPESLLSGASSFDEAMDISLLLGEVRALPGPLALGWLPLELEWVLDAGTNKSIRENKMVTDLNTHIEEKPQVVSMALDLRYQISLAFPHFLNFPDQSKNSLIFHDLERKSFPPSFFPLNVETLLMTSLTVKLSYNLMKTSAYLHTEKGELVLQLEAIGLISNYTEHHLLLSKLLYIDKRRVVLQLLYVAMVMFPFQDHLVPALNSENLHLCLGVNIKSESVPGTCLLGKTSFYTQETPSSALENTLTPAFLLPDIQLHVSKDTRVQRLCYPASCKTECDICTGLEMRVRKTPARKHMSCFAAFVVCHGDLNHSASWIKASRTIMNRCKRLDDRSYRYATHTHSTDVEVPPKRAKLSKQPGTAEVQQSCSATPEEIVSDSDDDISMLVRQEVDNTANYTTGDSFLDSIEQFFEQEETLGEAMTEKVANTINKALRGKTDNEKMKKLGEKYKRPSNINNLQTPRLEPVLWDQLKNGTKSIDANRQKLIAALNLTLLPIVKALEELHLNKTNSGDKLAEYVRDAFRIAAGQICAIYNERRESVKRELTSKEAGGGGRQNTYDNKYLPQAPKPQTSKLPTSLQELPTTKPSTPAKINQPAQALSELQKSIRALREELHPSQTTEEVTVCTGLRNYSLTNHPGNFKGGKTQKYLHKWKRVTNDRWILHTICGYRIELASNPYQTSTPKPIKFSDIENNQLQTEIYRLLDCDIIERVPFHSEPDEYVSNIFYRPKKDGKIRVILNLKHFNVDFMEHTHFKMETLRNAVNAMKKKCYFGSVDLSEAFFSIAVRSEDRKFFRFWFNGKKYQFRALVMGLTSAPRVFTKIMKPVFGTLRKQGHISTAYIDDSCLQGDTYVKCERNIFDTIELMDSLGLTVYPSKSSLIPSRQITFVGFILCSETMTVRLTTDKMIEIKTLCIQMVNSKFITIRKFAKLIGMMLPSEPGIQHAMLYYKPLEKI
ncbi:POL-like protein [Mya arenaria]|uniref:POL-like protein n=1 Tax=Mya arenaria TaxID=6604 RepID=A0ABY7DJ89_MYAAR|nr:POL-like protein [Mya arenaria]